MIKSGSTKQFSRAQTAASRARNTAIQKSTAQAEAKRNYKPPQSASKKVATRDAKQADKIQKIEMERAEDQALLQAQILAYYRSRADAFETDRAQLYAKLDDIRLKQDLVHKNEWELRKRQEEKRELETALERCQHVLYVEREKIMEMKKKGDTYRVK